MNFHDYGDNVLAEKADFLVDLVFNLEYELEYALSCVELSFADLLIDWHHADRDKRLSVVGYITQLLSGMEDENRALTEGI
jgi:hypothetical protein